MMPLRARLRTSGLKLKIPVRPASAVSNSPYAGGNRHSASPGRRGESRGRPDWPSESPRRRPSLEGERAAARGGSFPPAGPAHGPALDADGFRTIPIQYTAPAGGCDRLGNEASDAEVERLGQRARHLRDWLAQLSPAPSYPARYLSSPVPTFRSRTAGGRSPSSSVATSNDGSILTPTENLDNPLRDRRDSQGVLQSPDVLDPAKEDGFYLLKKDSQRRATLGKILKDDKHRICREWHSLLVKDVHDVVLSVEHLGTLVEGMKGYIEGAKNTNPLEKAVQDLRNALDYDGAGMNHLQLALYKVPEALNKVLRGHSIKPHWMFALEDLVRTAVQEAIGIISPELGAHLGTVNSQHPVEGILLVDHVDHHVPEMAHDNEGGSTSGVSTVSQRVGHGQMVSGLGRLREENRHLLSDLMKAQESYQDLLRQSLAEQRLHLQMLSQSLAASSLVQPPAHAPGVQRQAGVVEGPADPALVHWLEGLQLNRESMDRILGEELVLTDVLEVMGREDLKGLGLKAGPELRVWRAILAHRNIPLTPTSP